MKPYTVMLAYPDYLAETYGQETFMTSVMADDVTHAITQVVDQAMQASSDDDPEAWHVLMACEGVIHDIKHEAQPARTTVANIPLTEVEVVALTRTLVNLNEDTGSNLTARIAKGILEKLRAATFE